MTAKCYVRQKRLTFFSGVIAISSGAMPLSVFIRRKTEKNSRAEKYGIIKRIDPETKMIYAELP